MANGNGSIVQSFVKAIEEVEKSYGEFEFKTTRWGDLVVFAGDGDMHKRYDWSNLAISLQCNVDAWRFDL